jgi:hypothetical protein
MVDVREGPPHLLHMALATAPTSSIFYKTLLIGRMRRVRGPEIIINAVPFGPDDTVNVDKLAALDPAFLPRPHGPRPALAAEASAEAFEAFRAIWKRSRKNVASVSGPYHQAVWSAIRTGWREGYSAVMELRVSDEADIMAAREAVSLWPRYSRFVIAGTVADVQKLSVLIRQARSAAKAGASFELGIATTAAELPAALAALKEAGHPAQIAAVDLNGANIVELAAVAREFHCVLSVNASDHSEEDLKTLARETAGRFSCTVGSVNIEDMAEILLG